MNQKQWKAAAPHGAAAFHSVLTWTQGRGAIVRGAALVASCPLSYTVPLTSPVPKQTPAGGTQALVTCTGSPAVRERRTWLITYFTPQDDVKVCSKVYRFFPPEQFLTFV